MSKIVKCVFIFILLTEDVHCDRSKSDYYEEPNQGGKSFFFLGGLIRKFKSRWQNQNQPPSPYGSEPIFAGYYGCGFYNCRPPQPLLLQAVPPMQPVQQLQPIQPVSTIVQTPIVVQQAQVLQPNTYSQAVTQQNPEAAYQPAQQHFQYPSQVPTYGSPQPAYGNMQPAYGNLQPAYGIPQPYRPYTVYPPAYGPSIPGQIYQNAGCAYPGYCGRKI